MARHSANNAVLHVFVFAPYCARLGRAMSCICVHVTVQTMFCAPRVLCCTLTLVLVHLPRTLTVSLLSGTAKRCLSRPVLDSVTLSLDTGCWRFLSFCEHLWAINILSLRCNRWKSNDAEQPFLLQNESFCGDWESPLASDNVWKIATGVICRYRISEEIRRLHDRRQKEGIHNDFCDE